MRRRKAATRPLRGEVMVPGDKSISHRAAIVAALAAGRSRIGGINDGRDVAATLGALRLLGVTVTEEDGAVVVESGGREALAEPEAVLDAGNSGSTLRMLLGVCAGVPGLSVLTGDISLRGRPMGRVVDPLRAMGASIDGRAGGRHPPLVVRGASLRAAEVVLPVASAQVQTAVLLAGLAAVGRTSVRLPAPVRDHSARALRAAGVPVVDEDGGTAVEGPAQPEPVDRKVPGDLSSAMFLVVAATLIEGSDLTIAGVGLNPTRTAALEVLRRMGADVDWTIEGEAAGEPVGRLRARAAALAATTVTSHEVPLLIDEIPALAVAAAAAEGTTTFAGAGELRVKESDRIAALVTNLRTLGVAVEEAPDGLAVTGPTTPSAATVDSGGDHRIAMALAIAGVGAGVDVRVRGWSCVDVSWPGFIETLRRAQTGR